CPFYPALILSFPDTSDNKEPSSSGRKEKGRSAQKVHQVRDTDTSDNKEPSSSGRKEKGRSAQKVHQVRDTDTSDNKEPSSSGRKEKGRSAQKVHQVRDTDANNNNEPSNVRRRRTWGGIQKARQVRDTDANNNNEPSSVRRRRTWGGTQKVHQVRVTGASNNNKPSSVRRRRTWGGVQNVHQVRDTVFINIQDPKVNFHLPELPVTCGMIKGTLYKEKLEKGSSEKCIEMADGTWLTPRELEVKGGRERSKNWKKSIYCGGLTLSNLIQDKLLPCPPPTRHKRKKTLPEGEPNRQPEARKEILPSQPPSAQNEAPPQPKRRRLQRKMQVPKRTPLSPFYLSAVRSQVTTLDSRPKYRAQLQAREWLHVTCRVGKGRLYKKEFASAYRGKCIQTETGWYTPAEFLAKDPEFEIASWTHSIYCGRLSLQCLIENKILNLHESGCGCAICKEEDIFPENSNECFVCTDGGKLFCCDSCPRSFHGDCHIPAVSQENGAQWFCTFCIIRMNKEKRSSYNKSCQLESEALKHQMCFEQQVKCEYLLMKMYCCRESMLFATDPRNFTAYSKCVREPMWLDLIKKRLSDETYNTVEGFVLDMRLIFNNCKKFNKDNQFGHLGAKMKEKFEKDFKEVFNIEK
ncbi:nuclear body protein SP140-like protein, partial [Sarcophilus harrisii]|uniref:nuclear body protein SP140-like protein n=1 Tax=Sarcophilus harrisii TaxID=9305 RepID=UPI001301AC0C